MSLQKIVEIAQISIEQNGIILVKESTTVKDGEQIIGATSYHRTSYAPGQSLANAPQQVIEIANLVWTEQIIADYQAKMQEAIIVQPTE